MNKQNSPDLMIGDYQLQSIKYQTNSGSNIDNDNDGFNKISSSQNVNRRIIKQISDDNT